MSIYDNGNERADCSPLCCIEYRAFLDDVPRHQPIKVTGVYGAGAQQTLPDVYYY